MRTDGFLGNAAAKAQLSGQIDSDKPANTLILLGEEGSGKRTLAKILANALVCGGSGEKPCGSCHHCIKAATDSHPDIIHIISENKSGSISAKQARGIIEKAYLLPNEAERMVFILHNSELMDVITQNILLKVLEEPPERVHFILLCSDLNRLLPTVVSRAVTVRLCGVDEDSAVREVSRRVKDSSAGDIVAAYLISGGNIGRMISLVSDSGFKNSLQKAEEIAASSIGHDSFELLSLMSVYAKDKDGFQNLLGLLQLIYKDALLIANGSDIKPLSPVSSEIAMKATPERISYLYKAAADTEQSSKYNPNRALQQTYFCSLLMNKT